MCLTEFESLNKTGNNSNKDDNDEVDNIKKMKRNKTEQKKKNTSSKMVAAKRLNILEYEKNIKYKQNKRQFPWR